MTFQLVANGVYYCIDPVPLHRRNRRGRPYSRPTEWIAQAGRNPIVWGRTREECIAALKRQLGLHLRVVS
jgi:hypothetical protein